MHVSWYEVFDAALSSRPVVAVSHVAEAHLGRRPTRSEITSARRAANTYARGSNAQTLHIWARRADGRKILVLLLARPDADLDDTDLDDTDQLHAVAASRPAVPRTRGLPRGAQGVESLLSAIVKSAHSSRRVDLDHLDPEHARHLADELTDALDDFRRLRDRLHRHGHQPRTTNSPGPPEQ